MSDLSSEARVARVFHFSFFFLFFGAMLLLMQLLNSNNIPSLFLLYLQPNQTLSHSLPRYKSLHFFKLFIPLFNLQTLNPFLNHNKLQDHNFLHAKVHYYFNYLCSNVKYELECPICYS